MSAFFLISRYICDQLLLVNDTIGAFYKSCTFRSTSNGILLKLYWLMKIHEIFCWSKLKVAFGFSQAIKRVLISGNHFFDYLVSINYANPCAVASQTNKLKFLTISTSVFLFSRDHENHLIIPWKIWNKIPMEKKSTYFAISFEIFRCSSREKHRDDGSKYILTESIGHRAARHEEKLSHREKKMSSRIAVDFHRYLI